MQVVADGLERSGYAVQNIATREISLMNIFPTHGEADTFCQRVCEQVHRDAHRVVPVTVMVTRQDG